MDNERDIQIECLNLGEIHSTDVISKYLRSKITVYYFSPENFYSLLPDLYEILSKEEKLKAATFHFIDHGKRYIICHGILRILLSEKLKTEPEILTFKKRLNGKPYLEGNKLFFNLSHTKELCAIAITDDNEVGVDIEKIKDNTDYQDISEYFCSKDEQQQIKESINPLEKFFLFWTRKEALLKAIGLGLNTALQEVNIGKNSNSVNYSQLCRNQEMNVCDNYFIYSGQVGNHFLSVATSSEADIELTYFPEWVKSKNSRYRHPVAISN